jgi:CheY-like chemotaxis protein
VTRRFGGTGLGMAITRSLVDSMQGEISVTSEPGKGTVFVVSLPLGIAVDYAEKAADPPPKQLDLKAISMLVADDNETNRVVLEMMLTQLGADVTLVNDGASAVRAWRPGRFDCILLDITMPGMSGPTALQKIRALEVENGLDPVPIIAATANVMAHQVAEYLAMGFDACVAKPINSAALSHAIRSLMFS